MVGCGIQNLVVATFLLQFIITWTTNLLFRIIGLAGKCFGGYMLLLIWSILSGFVLRVAYLPPIFFLICIWARTFLAFFVVFLRKLLIIYLGNVPNLSLSGSSSATMWTPPSLFLSSGNWLTNPSYSQFTLTVIVAGAWFIWKSRCDAIFNNSPPNFSAIVNRSIAHAREHSKSNRCLLGKRLILYNFSGADDHFLFTHAILNESRQVRAIGFFLSSANLLVSFAGCLSQPADDNSSDALLALDVALQFALDFQLPVKHIFSAYHTDLAMLKRPDHVIAWHLHT